jgi:hypothetical protein
MFLPLFWVPILTPPALPPEALAGHISEKMKNKYAHIRIEVKRKAVEALQRIAARSCR